MRKIEQQMNAAIAARKNWSGGNTAVFIDPDNTRGDVYLHGNHIAMIDFATGKTTAMRYTLRNWPTATTKSRLRALGVNVKTKDHVTYLEGVAI